MTLGECLRAAVKKLETSGVAMSSLEARYLLCEAGDFTQPQLLLDSELAVSPKVVQLMDTLVERRVRGEPLSRILGHAEFWGLSLIVTPAVLDPRGDTETLVRAARTLMGERLEERLRILDLGTGSGALLCALLSEFKASWGVGVDISFAASVNAKQNLMLNGLDGRGSVLSGDWSKSLIGGFDLIISNPPYIEHGAISELAVEVRDYDPALALDGGTDGYDCYREIIPDLPRLLKSGGWAILEAGAGQAGAIKATLESSGFTDAVGFEDYGGHERAIAVRKSF